MFRRTKQRQVVLETVQASDDHPSAMQVYRRARRRCPGVSFATIYNALRWWVNRGQLREFTFGDRPTRYDRNRDRHDHAICTRCGRLIDVNVRLPKRVQDEVRKQTGLCLTEYHAQFLGLCSDCSPRNKVA